MRTFATGILLCALALSARAAPAFALHSPQIRDGGTIARAQVYTQCGGDNVSPPLQWSGAPAATQSYAVTVFDPDAPGGGFWHWVAFDISVGAHGLNADAGRPHSGDAPGDMAQGRNGFGDIGYSGPCPPPGKPHRYVFTVYALDVPELDVGAGTDVQRTLTEIRKHALASASFTALYGR